MTSGGILCQLGDLFELKKGRHAQLQSAQQAGGPDGAMQGPPASISHDELGENIEKTMEDAQQQNALREEEKTRRDTHSQVLVYAPFLSPKLETRPGENATEDETGQFVEALVGNERFQRQYKIMFDVIKDQKAAGKHVIYDINYKQATKYEQATAGFHTSKNFLAMVQRVTRGDLQFTRDSLCVIYYGGHGNLDGSLSFEGEQNRLPAWATGEIVKAYNQRADWPSPRSFLNHINTTLKMARGDPDECRDTLAIAMITEAILKNPPKFNTLLIVDSCYFGLLVEMFANSKKMQKLPVAVQAACKGDDLMWTLALAEAWVKRQKEGARNETELRSLTDKGVKVQHPVYFKSPRYKSDEFKFLGQQVKPGCIFSSCCIPYCV